MPDKRTAGKRGTTKREAAAAKEPPQLTEFDLDRAEHGDPEPPSIVSIHVAMSRVMADVQNVSKSQRNTQQNYNFRGIDAVVNAVGPALRKHGVIVVPTGVEHETERYKTRSNAEMKGITVKVSFRFYGPQGDYIDAVAAGEAADAGDKAMPKAHSVAFRTLLLQALCIPTDEPDPDTFSHERAATDPRREELVRQEPRADVPKTWPETFQRLGSIVGATGDEAAAFSKSWCEQAVWSKYGKSSIADLTPQERTEAFTLTRSVLLQLEEAVGDLTFSTGVRQTVAGAFAAKWDGLALLGPAWRLDPDEMDRPTYTEWAALQEEERQKRLAEGKATDDDIPFGEEDGAQGDEAGPVGAEVSGVD